MLVYTRVNHQSSSGSSQPANGHASNEHQVDPPSKALEVVNRLNAEHSKACEDFAKRWAFVPSLFARGILTYHPSVYSEREAREKFDRTRSIVIDIYRTWNVQSRDEVHVFQ